MSAAVSFTTVTATRVLQFIIVLIRISVMALLTLIAFTLRIVAYVVIEPPDHKVTVNIRPSRTSFFGVSLTCNNDHELDATEGFSDGEAQGDTLGDSL